MMTSNLKVTLCYSPDDKSIVSELYQQLSAEGWMDVWMDEDTLPGEDKEMEVEQAINDADITLICLSTHAIKNQGNVHHILRIALSRAGYKPEKAVYIIPIRLEDCELPSQLRQWQSADYFEGNKERAYRNLLKSLRKQSQLLESSANSKNPGAKEKAVDKVEVLAAATPPNSTGVGGDVSGKNIIVGNNNIINVMSQSDASQPHILIPPSKIKASKNDKPKPKPNPLPFVIAGIAAVLVIGSLILGGAVEYLTGTGGMASPSTSEPILIPEIVDGVQPNVDNTQTSSKDNMIYIPAGEFSMGSSLNTEESPIHTVNVPEFWIDKTEVTNALYALCVQDKKCTSPNNTAHFTDPAYAFHPVVYVSWNDAKTYCEYAGKRLPTESEWEKTARGTDQRTYPWGNNAPNPNLLNYDNNKDTTMIGIYLNGTSPYGVLDMAGNVWEWVSDWYSPAYYARSPLLNPTGPENGDARVIRGGSWKDSENLVRAAARYGYSPLTFLDNLGFRCAQSQ
jgi:formylglycine-generating enzyme required for sulfatase activity